MLHKKSDTKRLRHWITLINANFRVLYKFRNEKHYKIIGAGTVVKLVGKKTALEAFSKVIGSNQQILSVKLLQLSHNVLWLGEGCLTES